MCLIISTNTALGPCPRCPPSARVSVPGGRPSAHPAGSSRPPAARGSGHHSWFLWWCWRQSSADPPSLRPRTERSCTATNLQRTRVSFLLLFLYVAQRWPGEGKNVVSASEGCLRARPDCAERSGSRLKGIITPCHKQPNRAPTTATKPTLQKADNGDGNQFVGDNSRTNGLYPCSCEIPFV